MERNFGVWDEIDPETSKFLRANEKDVSRIGITNFLMTHTGGQRSHLPTRSDPVIGNYANAGEISLDKKLFGIVVNYFTSEFLLNHGGARVFTESLQVFAEMKGFDILANFQKVIELYLNESKEF